MNNLVKVKLHGDIAKYIEAEWTLSVKSVKEAISAINSLTKNRFNRYFIDNNKLRARYRVLINGQDFLSQEPDIDESNYHIVTESEIFMKKGNLKTIDIVPVLEAAASRGSSGRAKGGISTVLGVILLVVGIYSGNPGLAMAGLALLSSGVTALLTRPPKSSFDKVAPDGKSQSYLFSGPVNTVGEGGPVPIGYGSMLVGSQVVSSAFKIEDYSVPAS